MLTDYTNIIPLYYTIADDLRREIQEGNLKEGDQVPTEHELSKRYNVSRGTVRHAMMLLFQEGLLVRKRGLGTFVTMRKFEQNFLKLMGFTEVMHEYDLEAHARLLQVEAMKPSQRIAELLNLSSGQKAVHIERLRFAGDEPLIIERSFFVYDLFSPLLECDLEDSSIYELLSQRTNVKLGRAKQSIEAKICGPEDASLFNIQLGSPMLLMKRQIYTADEKVFEYSEDTYRGDRLKFKITTTPYGAPESWKLDTISASESGD